MGVEKLQFIRGQIVPGAVYLSDSDVDERIALNHSAASGLVDQSLQCRQRFGDRVVAISLPMHPFAELLNDGRCDLCALNFRKCSLEFTEDETVGLSRFFGKIGVLMLKNERNGLKKCVHGMLLTVLSR